MEHERCYVYSPLDAEERPSKRQRTSNSNPQPQLPERLSAYREIWALQEHRIQETLEEADSATQEKIVSFVAASAPVEDEPQVCIPTGLIVAGPSIASHGPFFMRLGRRIRQETRSAYVVLTSGESPNLKTFLKNLIRKVTSRIDNDEEDRTVNSSRKGPRLLDFDLGHVQEWQKKNQAQNIVVAIQDSEAFDTGLLVELVDLFYSWLDRLPFILLIGIATSAEYFEERLSGKSLRHLQGQKFDVTQSDVIIEKLFSATVASPDIGVRIGPNLSRRLLDRQKDHVQNIQDFVDGLKYAYMSHFYASYPTVFLNGSMTFKDFPSDAFEALRNLPSFRKHVEELLANGNVQDVRQLLASNQYLYEQIIHHTRLGQSAFATVSRAARLLACIREALQVTPTFRPSTIWTRAAAGEFPGAPMLRETMLSVKKAPSDKLAQLFASLQDMDTAESLLSLNSFQQELDKLIKENASSGPLRSQDDVRNDSLRTTVIAQKVLLSKHKAALSQQDKEYSDLVGRFHNELEKYFTAAFIDPRRLFLSELLMYDLKSPHTEVFQPKPRFAIERALASPHDYLGCDCCQGDEGGDGILSATQPATAILYQLYVESGTLINVSDLRLAFNAIAGDGDENESKTMAIMQRALAELRYLGLVKPSRKKTDHIAKMSWKGL